MKKTKLQDSIDALFNPITTKLPENMGKPDWVYRDIRWLTKEYWDKLLSLIGAKNYRILAYSRRIFSNDENVYYGGQFLISPEGIENLKAWKNDEDSISK